MELRICCYHWWLCWSTHLLVVPDHYLSLSIPLLHYSSLQVAYFHHLVRSLSGVLSRRNFYLWFNPFCRSLLISPRLDLLLFPLSTHCEDDCFFSFFLPPDISEAWKIRSSLNLLLLCFCKLHNLFLQLESVIFKDKIRALFIFYYIILLHHN